MTRTRIGDLPTEVLVLVFEHGSQMALHKLGLPFIIAISHVSRRWRSIVYATASVWRAIPSTTETILNIYLRQSQNYSLDIYLHARPRVGDVGVLEITNLLLGHSNRWRSLHIRATTAPLLYVVVSRLRKARAPQLQRFELFVDAQPHTVGQLPLIFIDEPPPKLVSVTLEGIGLLGSGVPILSGLSSLVLARLPRGQLSYNTFRDVLMASPRLKHLTLDNIIPKMVFDIEYAEIIAPHLTSLELAVPEGNQYVQQLFSVLSFPSIRVLRYASSWDLAWRHFELALPVLAAKCPHLRELYFAITGRCTLAGEGVDVAFFTAFPELRLFSLSVHQDTSAMYFLQPWVDLQGGDSGDVWPLLGLLTLRAPYDADSEIPLDECLELLGSLRLSRGLLFEVFQEYIFADQRPNNGSDLSRPLDAPPSYRD